MVRNPYLTTKNHGVAKRDASGKTNLTGQHAVLTHHYVVPDMHKIINLGSPADDGVAERAAVNRDVGSDFNVVVDEDAAQLRNPEVTLRTLFKAKSILSDARPRKDPDSIANQRMTQCHMSADPTLTPDPNSAANDRTVPDYRIAPDLYFPTYECAWGDHRSLTDSRSRVDGYRWRMRTRPRQAGVGVQGRCHFREGNCRALRDPIHRTRWHGRSMRVCDEKDVPTRLSKRAYKSVAFAIRKLIRASVLQRRDIADLHAR
jgi:hypothetical protein